MNPINLIKGFITKGLTPENMIMNIMQKNSNPMMNRLVNMAKNGDTQGVENFARNIFNEKGRNFDEEFSAFMKQIR